MCLLCAGYITLVQTCVIGTSSPYNGISFAMLVNCYEEHAVIRLVRYSAFKPETEEGEKITRVSCWRGVAMQLVTMMAMSYKTRQIILYSYLEFHVQDICFFTT